MIILFSLLWVIFQYIDFLMLVLTSNVDLPTSKHIITSKFYLIYGETKITF